jgi:phosphoglycolate phosphatase/putative hydrolase of the HAD superfamily
MVRRSAKDVSMQPISWDAVRAVVFDVDGTLYDQRRMRRRMAAVLLLHCLRHPQQLGLLRTVQIFRRIREELGEEEVGDVARAQYRRPAERLAIDPETVRRVAEDWLGERPLAHLPACRAPAIDTLFAALRDTGRTIAVFSDYLIEDKLNALGLRADLCVSALDPDVDRLKPNARGLERILQRLDLPAAACVMIGDRDDRDGEAARRVGMPFLRKVWGGKGEAGTIDDYAALAALVREGAR